MHSTRLVVTMASLLAVAMPRTVLAQSSVGWSYTVNMKSDSGGGRVSSIAMRQTVTDRYLRMEWVQLSGMGATMESVEGMYTIFDGVDSTVTMVIPAQKMASIIALPQTPDIPTLQISSHADERSKLEALGRGDRLLGHATERYRKTTVGTMQVTFLGQTCSRSITGTTDLWIAPDLDFQGVASAVMKHVPIAVGGTISAGDGTITMPKGVALRTINRTTFPDSTGATRNVTMTNDIVEFTHGPVSDALFAVPAGYRTMDMRTVVANLPAGLLDSIKAANADKTPTPNFCGGSK